MMVPDKEFMTMLAIGDGTLADLLFDEYGRMRGVLHRLTIEQVL
jgi:hypothetical protein